jgi:hypothetical protein
MPVYAFNLTIDNRLCPDIEGKSFPDDAAALKEAEIAALELMADALRHNIPAAASKLTLVAESGSELLSVDLDVSDLLNRVNPLRSPFSRDV